MRFLPSCFKMRIGGKVEFLQNPHVLLMLVELICIPALLSSHGCSKANGSLHSPHLISVLLRKSRITEMEEIQDTIQDKTQILKMRTFPERFSAQVTSVIDGSSGSRAPLLWLSARGSSQFPHSRGMGKGLPPLCVSPAPLCMSCHVLALLSKAG